MKVVPNYCRSFRKEAHKVWFDMSEAERFGLPRNEETTTEELLLNLARKHKGRGLDVEAYTKAEESANGADWAFWFSSGPSQGFGLRIQAKRIYQKSGNYDKLFHQSDSQKEASKATGRLNPNQCETLLNYRDGLIPIYTFYNSDKLDLRQAMGWPHVGRWFKTCFPHHSGDWGISAASAIAVKNATWGKNNKPGDFPMVPWNCLVCSCCWDSRSVDNSLPNLVAHGAKQLFALSQEDEGDVEADRPEMNFEPQQSSPSWVQHLREGEDSRDLLENSMEEMNLRGIVEISEVALYD
ncbi:DUF6615 family protein [Tateyamaria sp. Alg231-49]|uniref:DUF6615 family protein n=1 Tax=Tateyamaria sp. Alg231-49 TaxID=1922219 RepID=UPI000D55BF89|nr:DUF6615 family protein [Tateyamaria sp. Alg231-49]